jgi:hypothetical protein
MRTLLSDGSGLGSFPVPALCSPQQRVCTNRDFAVQTGTDVRPDLNRKMMSDRTSGNAGGRPASERGHDAARESPVPEHLDEAECLRLISSGGVGRVVYSGRFGPTAIPVLYKLHKGTIVFRTAHDSSTDEDLRTGIAGAEFKVTFEIDDINPTAREGWSVLIQGPAHHVKSETEHASVLEAGVEPWVGGVRELYLLITPTRITGRRTRRL